MNYLDLVITFGKYADGAMTYRMVADTYPDYAWWMVRSADQLDEQVREALQDYLEERGLDDDHDPGEGDMGGGWEHDDF